MTTRQLSPIQQVAHSAAYRPEDGRRMAQNRVLRDFDDALRWVRMKFAVSRPALAEQRAELIALACARVAERLDQAGAR